MDIHTLSELSGLSRGQIDQLISRWNIVPHGRHRPGSARTFTNADAFNFCIAGHAARFGISMPRIRDLIAALPLPKVDDEFRQVETFPGADLMEDALLVVNIDGDGFRASFVERRELVVHGAVALVFPAGLIAALIGAAHDDE